MSVPSVMKPFLTWAGRMLAAGGVYFVLTQLFEVSEQMEWEAWPPRLWMALGGLALVYGSANLLAVVSWRLVLAYLGVDARWRSCLYVYASSQIARYLPGNIFHLAGRQFLGAKMGWPSMAVAKSAGAELLSLAVAGALFSVFVLPLVTPLVSSATSCVIFAALLLGVVTLARVILSSAIAYATFWHVVFLFLTGLVFVGVMNTLVRESSFHDLNGLQISAAYVFAWLVGLVTPGAPAGVGIREFVLLALLGKYFPDAELVAVVVLGRGVTMVGDALFYLVSFLPIRDSKSL